MECLLTSAHETLAVHRHALTPASVHLERSLKQAGNGRLGQECAPGVLLVGGQGYVCGENPSASARLVDNTTGEVKHVSLLKCDLVERGRERLQGRRGQI